MGFTVFDREFLDVIKYKHFTCNLPVLVVDGVGPNLLGCNWFQALNISIYGVYFLSPDTSYAGMSNEAFSHTIMNFPAVSGHSTSCYKRLPLHIDINPAVVPVCRHAGPWASAILPVLKCNGTLRLCADYKGKLNFVLFSYTYKSPTMDQVLSELAGGCIYRIIDLEEAHTQIPVDGETSHMLTVNTVQRLHSVTQLPFGIKISSFAFQRIIDGLLGPVKGVIAYQDNICVKGTTVTEYRDRLLQVLHILNDAGFKVNSDKCVWQSTSIEVLGFRLDVECIHRTTDKTAAITNYANPSIKQELQSLLGLISFYGRFFKDKATILDHLHRLLDSKSKWAWTTNHQLAL
ncbi:hypothetical protein PR048_011570 [Dryococelus australis]|uniref:Reverse transcriptase domain-containing protein n=1 Tax=Dryococelus australis TaxID=614101 RepID=A0ABQ9HM02_9NEOP|nr:hypothetical protein PR048_011570 [Dryococelus australis]